MGTKKKTTTANNIAPDLDVIVLAAGLGTRMKSDLPKVLHPVCGQPMIAILLEQIDRAIRETGGTDRAARFNIVIGHGRELVEKTVLALREAGRVTFPVVFTVQEQQLGTGHAVRLALEQPGMSGHVAVFNGDLPLFTAEDFKTLLQEHLSRASSATLGSAVLDDAGQYGRIIRKGKTFTGVIEYKDATAAQRKIREYNGGVYLFDRELLVSAMRGLNNRNAAGEFYLPDVFGFARKKGRRILALPFSDSTPLQGVNNMKELAAAQKILYLRTAEKLMSEGVFLAEPEHTYVGPEVEVGRGCVIGPFTMIHGRSRLADKARVGAHCDLNEVIVGEGSAVLHGSVCEKSQIGRNSVVGPLARLRPGSRVGDDVKIGNFVELKEASIGNHTNVAHLSYVGDAEIGSNCNLGCGFITCNYDGTVKEGRRKHRTVIGNNVFVGSDCQLVAPIQIQDGTYIASGSTVTDSVKESDSLVLARTRQTTKPGYAKKYRK